MSEDITLNLALFYAGEFSWRVLPLQAREKKPALLDWPRQASIDPAVITEWFTNGHRGGNLGVAMGPLSALFVLDVDDNGKDKRGLDALEELEDKYGKLPLTPMVITPGGGRHYYFRHPGFPLKSSLGQWLDIRTEGHQVVVPPSIHPNGGTYAWEESCRPSICPVADAPVWLLELLALPSISSEGFSDDYAPSFIDSGWTLSHVDSGNRRHWTRPGKDPRDGASATEYPLPDHHVVIWSTSVTGAPVGVPLSPKRLAQVLGLKVPESSVARFYLVGSNSVTIKQPRWLWRHRVPLGGVSLLVGQEGFGKSTVALNLAAQVTRGELEGDLSDPASVVYASDEDSESSTLVPRLVAAGADLERVFFVRIDGLQGGMTIPRDLDDLSKAMQQQKAKLLVLDPFSSHLGDEKMDSHRERDVRRAVGPLAAAMDDLQAAAIGIMHWNKGQAPNALDRILGSRGFSAAARAILGVGEDPKDDQQKVLILLKSNLGRLDVPALTFSITEKLVTDPADGYPFATSAVMWTGDRAGVRSSDLFKVAETSEEQGAVVAACGLIVQALSDGPLDVKELDQARKAASISEITFRRARQFLEVVTEPVRDVLTGQIISWRARLP